MRRTIAMTAIIFGGLLSRLATADHMVTGVATRFHSSGEQFGVYMTQTTGCPEGWYFSARNDYSNGHDYKAVMALALAAYAMQKTISLFYSTSQCGAQRFTTIDTQS